VLSDVSTCAFGPGACTIVVHFPGLASQESGCDVVEAFVELFAAAKAEPSGALVELARLNVQAPPMRGGNYSPPSVVYIQIVAVVS
jgi:hypothetical protein